jgi:hypothetical protein
MAIPLQTARPPQRLNFKVNKFKGVNKSVTPSQIDDGQSPDMLNFLLDSEFALDKRTGYYALFDKLLGAYTWADGEWSSAAWTSGTEDNPVKGLFLYRKSDGNIERLMFQGGSLYKWTDTTNTLIYTGLADTIPTTFQVNDIFYFMDGTGYYSYNGTTVSDMTGANAYAPTITLGRAPTGGGTANEQLNLIGTGFKDSFSGNGSSTTYTLSYAGLASTTVTCTIGGVAKTEGTHFTVDRTNGTVNFSAGTSPHGAPASGTNNVVITAYKTWDDYTTRKEKIIKCTLSIFFGGTNDTRVLVSGHPTLKNIVYRSSLTSAGYADPTYFPENTYSLVGANNESILNVAKQYDTLIIVKESTTYTMAYEINGGTAQYTTKPINDTVGIYAKNSLAILDNNPTFVSNKGVYQLIQGQVRDERNMKHLSENIDEDLLNEANLDDAVGYDFDKKYYICLPSGKTYVYDYAAKEWLIWNNIKASCFYDEGNYLYFGASDCGCVYKFKKVDDVGAFYDDGAAINSYWKSKVFNLKRGDFQKLIDRLIITLKPYSISSAKIYYSADKKVSKYVKEIDLVSFDFNTLDFSNFSFESFTLPQTKTARINENSTVYFQIEIVNNEAGEGLGITEIGILHAPQKYV